MATPIAGTGTDAQVRQFVLSNFPSYSFVLGDPELYNLFKSAIIPGAGTDNGTLNESTSELLSKLEATNWWKTHGPAARAYYNNQNTDPGSVDEQVRAKDAEVHQIANQMGLADNQVDIDHFARQAVQFGWNGPELQEQLASQAQMPTSGDPYAQNIGTIDNAMLTLKQQAAKYMVNLDPNTAFSWARDIAAGHHQVGDYDAQFIDWAKGKFPTLAGSIDNGITPQQTFQPLQQEVARLLELPDYNQVDLMNDPKFSKIISYTDPKTNAPRPMTTSETQSYVRSMDQWGHTKQGQQAQADMSEGILNMFGKISSSAGSVSGPSNQY